LCSVFPLVAVLIGEGGAGLHEKTAAVNVLFVTTNSPTNASWLEILFGVVNPSGKLTVTIPRHSGHLPVYYNAKKSKRYWLEKGWGKSYADMDHKPLYPFGHGLSYTTFEYSNLRFDKTEPGIAGTIQVSVDIQNTGKRAGQEVVQLYIQDVIATVSTSEMELRGFEKIRLNPGQKKEVAFTIGPEHLALYNRHLDRVVEPGEFKVKVGASSDDIRLEDSIWVK